MKRLFANSCYVIIFIAAIIIIPIQLLISFAKLAWAFSTLLSDDISVSLRSYILSVDYPDDKQ